MYWRSTSKRREAAGRQALDGGHSSAGYLCEIILTISSAQVSNCSYSRNFVTNNLIVYSIGISEAYCYLWNEDQVMCGTNEIATYVYYFLIENCVIRYNIL